MPRCPEYPWLTRYCRSTLIHRLIPLQNQYYLCPGSLLSVPSLSNRHHCTIDQHLKDQTLSLRHLEQTEPQRLREITSQHLIGEPRLVHGIGTRSGSTRPALASSELNVSTRQ